MREAVFFDFGDTLARNRETYAGFFEKYLRKAGVTVAPGHVEDLFAGDRLKHLKATRSWTAEDGLKRYWLSVYQAVLASGGVSEAQGAMLAGEMWTEHLAADSYVLYDDALACLESLAKRGLTLAIISNFDASLRDKVRHLGIEGLFARVFISSVVGHSKPSPAIFRHAVEDLGPGFDRYFYVGDDYREDYLASRDAGLHGVWLNRAGIASEIREQIGTLADLSAYLSRV